MVFNIATNYKQSNTKESNHNKQQSVAEASIICTIELYFGSLSSHRMINMNVIRSELRTWCNMNGNHDIAATVDSIALAFDRLYYMKKVAQIYTNISTSNYRHTSKAYWRKNCWKKWICSITFESEQCEPKHVSKSSVVAMKVEHMLLKNLCSSI